MLSISPLRMFYERQKPKGLEEHRQSTGGFIFEPCGIFFLYRAPEGELNASSFEYFKRHFLLGVDQREVRMCLLEIIKNPKESL